jgi:hypothetical protein
VGETSPHVERTARWRMLATLAFCVECEAAIGAAKALGAATTGVAWRE